MGPKRETRLSTAEPKVLVLLARLDPGSSRLQVEVPEGAFEHVGVLHVQFLKFSYCETAGHNHFALPASTPFPPVAQAYEPHIEIPVPVVFDIDMRPPRQSLLQIDPNVTKRRRRTFRLEPPAVQERLDLWTLFPRVEDAQPAQAAAAAAGDGGVGGDGGNQPLWNDDEDDDGGRYRRAPPSPRRRDLNDTEVRVSFGIEPVDPRRSVGAITGATYDLNIKDMTLEAILQTFNNAFDYWCECLGNPFVMEATEQRTVVTKPRFAIAELNDVDKQRLADVGQAKLEVPADDCCVIELILPSCVGIAFESVDHFRMLGFEGATYDRQLTQNERGWLVGQVPPGFKYVVGAWQPIRRGQVTVFRSTRPVGKDMTGAMLLRDARRIAKKVYKIIPDAEFVLKPRFVVHPTSITYIADLVNYRPPADKVGGLPMLFALTEVVTHLFQVVYQLREIFRLINVHTGQPSIEGLYDRPARIDCLHAGIEFGSRAAAGWFGLQAQHFDWDLREVDEKSAEVVQRLLSPEAVRQARKAPGLNLAEMSTLRNEMRNIDLASVAAEQDIGFQRNEVAYYNRNVRHRHEGAPRDIPVVVEEGEAAGAAGGAADVEPMDDPTELFINVDEGDDDDGREGDDGGGQEAAPADPAQLPDAGVGDVGGGQDAGAVGGDGDGDGGGAAGPVQPPVVVIPAPVQPPVVVIPPVVVVAPAPAPPAPPRLTVQKNNPVSRPPERFYHLRTLGDVQTCAPPPAGVAPRPNVAFPFDSFYIISCDGEPKDFIQELGGSVCLAGSFTNLGLAPDDNPCNAGFELRNWSKGTRILEFVIYSHAIERYTNTSNVTGLARCTLAYNPTNL